MSKNPELLVWCDLETTGLDPQRNVILEIAVGIARFTSPFDLIHPVYQRVLNYGESSRKEDSIDKFVLDMHTKNNLWAECAQSNNHASTVDSELVHFLGCMIAEEKPVLAGSTVHFDLGFIRRWMPLTAKLLSHRVYDASGIKLFCQSLGMPALDSSTDTAHRAKEDMLFSIEHARRCAEWVTTR